MSATYYLFCCISLLGVPCLIKWLTRANGCLWSEVRNQKTLPRADDTHKDSLGAFLQQFLFSKTTKGFPNICSHPKLFQKFFAYANLRAVTHYRQIPLDSNYKTLAFATGISVLLRAFDPNRLSEAANLIGNCAVSLFESSKHIPVHNFAVALMLTRWDSGISRKAVYGQPTN